MSLNPNTYKLSDKTGKLTAAGEPTFERLTFFNFKDFSITGIRKDSI